MVRVQEACQSVNRHFEKLAEKFKQQHNDNILWLQWGILFAGLEKEANKEESA